MKKILLLLSIWGPFIVCGQADTTHDDKFNPQISGSADVYYRYNFNAPAGSFNNFTKFTNTQNSFAFGMASLKAVDSFGKASAVVSVGFGNRANEYNSADASNSFSAAIKELYMSYAVSNAVKITAGKWYKHFGYELPDANANHNYSMSYSFSFGPMSFTGIKADIALTKNLNLMVGIANPANISDLGYTPTKTVIAGATFNAMQNRLKVKFGYQGYRGVNTPYLLTSGYYLYKRLNQYDFVMQFQVNNKLDLAYNYTYQEINDGLVRNWNGHVLYATYKIKPTVSVSFRGEFVDDDAALKIGTDVFDGTLSANFTISNRLKFIPEVRFDRSPDHIFLKGNAIGAGTTFTGLIAAVYSFGKQ